MGEEHVYATPSPYSTIAVGRCTTIKPSECKVCGVPAFHKHFGAVSCPPCKTFFKRNAEIGLVCLDNSLFHSLCLLRIQDALKCRYNGNCEINFNTRQVCTSCRLAKCFASGMTVDMIRAPRPKKVKKPDTKIIPVIKNEQKQLQIVRLIYLLK